MKIASGSYHVLHGRGDGPTMQPCRGHHWSLISVKCWGLDRLRCFSSNRAKEAECEFTYSPHTGDLHTIIMASQDGGYQVTGARVCPALGSLVA